ncbi:MAG TPA: hypothetical protein VJ844_09830 [Mucilaginibacter sp.]|nr:hypothetical protein [Mucilaginibacter sp.]
MKTFRLSIIALLLMGAFSCKKDSSNASASVTSDQAADMAASAFASNSGGVASMTDAVTINAQGLASTGSQSINSLGVNEHHQECGSTLTDSATYSGSNNAVSYDYFVKYSHTLNCNVNSQPDNLANALIYHGTFDGPRVSTTAKGTATATIAGLTQAAQNYVINGEYKREGTFVSKVGNKATGNSNIDIVVTNLKLAKPSRTIASGTATFTVSGVAGKHTYSFTGTATFNGDGTATLVITGGATYTITLATGVYTKQ